MVRPEVLRRARFSTVHPPGESAFLSSSIDSLSLTEPSVIPHQSIKRSDTFVSLIKQSAHFRLVTSPCLSLSVFRLEPSGCSLGPEQLNALNRAFYARLSARHDVAFTQTDLNGTICVRCAVGAERTEEADILQTYEVLCEEADKTLKEWDGKNGESSEKH